VPPPPVRFFFDFFFFFFLGSLICVLLRFVGFGA